MTTGDDIVTVLDELKRDLSIHRNKWVNDTLEAYLHTMIQWLEERDEVSLEHPTWEFVGQLLQVPKYYE